MSFITALTQELNLTTTANGALAYKSTLNKCLDLFGKIGACRQDIEQAKQLFAHAYKEDPETATRILFWARDIRGGQGERNIFRQLFQYLVNTNIELGKKLVNLVPEYGRWDDLFILEDTSAWEQVLTLVASQLKQDREGMKNGNTISLLGKWLPSINTSSKDSKRLGRKISKHLNLSEKEYRKLLTELRSYIKIVEQKMCAKEWKEINYSEVPSVASFMYRKAFGKQDTERYGEFLEKVKNGEAKINASTLYPYSIVEQYLYKGAKEDKTIDLQWEALPNYMEGKEFNGLVVADVSGSMQGTPMTVSISLAMYIAERNTAKVWKDKFITFSQSPELQEIVGNTIGERISNLSRAAWGYNTNLQKVFDTILSAAKKHAVAKDDMPQKVIIVSDMQFDEACKPDYTNYENIKASYKEAGYELPQLVFWNVHSYGNVPMTMHDTGTCLVSGCSPSILKAVLTDKVITPLNVLEDAVYTERYMAVGNAFV